MKNISGSVSVNDFVKRQIKGSGKTYTDDLTFEKIASHGEEQLKKGHYTEGYREGVILVQTAPELSHHFICPFTKITEKITLEAKIVKRRPQEEPYIQMRALNGSPLNTGSVDLILYHHNVLSETNEESSDADFELISFHAIPEGLEKMPMGPVTMMRNQLQLPGGTKATYESEKWAEAVKFWQEYAVLDQNIE